MQISAPASSRPRLRTLLVTSVIPVLLLTGSLAGCGTKDAEGEPRAEPSVQLPTGNVEVPSGVSLTKAGTKLDFGEAAVVAYEPNIQRSSVLSMSVEGVQTGRIKDFSSYQLDKRTRASMPYYVQVKVKNVGKGDLSRAAVPLLAVDSRDTLIQPSSFNNKFKKCASTPLPAGFTSGKSAKLCLVYLVPEGGKLTQMSFRPLQAFEPIVWRGDIKSDKDKAGKKKGTKGKSGKKGAKKP